MKGKIITVKRGGNKKRDSIHFSIFTSLSAFFALFNYLFNYINTFPKIMLFSMPSYSNR